MRRPPPPDLGNRRFDAFVRKLAPQVDYQVWDGVGHFIMMEQPEKFNAELLKLIE